MNKSTESQSILIVDDDASLSDALARWLRSEGFEVRTAYDGMQALRKVEENQPDLVLADVSMPVLDGIGLAREVMRMGIPVVLLSAAVSRKAAPAGVPFVAKPFDIDVLYGIITDILT